MTKVGEREIRTQRRVVGFLRNALGYDYLGQRRSPILSATNGTSRSSSCSNWFWSGAQGQVQCGRSTANLQGAAMDIGEVR